MADPIKAEEKPLPYKLIKPLHYKGRLIDPEVTKDASVDLYLDQAESLKKQGIIA